jgi:phage baseplate assembly protein V
MSKNLLADTDYTKGWDNRFGTTALIGYVSEIDVTDKHANVRVIMPDRVDHKNQPLITKPVPVMQVASTAKKSFAVPRKDDMVLMVKLPNGTSNYAVIGSFYTPRNPPPVTDPMLDYVEYDDGSTMQFDANSGELTWKLKGDMLWDNEGDFTLKLQGNISIEVEGDADIKAQGDVVVEGQTVRITGTPITLEGDIQHTGNMNTSGIHTDSRGLHSSGKGLEVEERLAALEARVAQLEQMLPMKLNST